MLAVNINIIIVIKFRTIIAMYLVSCHPHLLYFHNLGRYSLLSDLTHLASCTVA